VVQQHLGFDGDVVLLDRRDVPAFGVTRFDAQLD
jgi:hypothetical protein